LSKLSLYNGLTSKIVAVKLTKLSDGSDLTGVLYSDLLAYYWIEGASAAVAITLATATPGTWTSGGFIQRDATHMPGHYELHVPNSAFASGKSVVGCIQANGGTSAGMKTCDFEIQEDTSTIVQYALHKNTAHTTFPFKMCLASDHISPYGGAANTVSGQVSIDGAAFTNLVNTAAIVLIGNGWFYINLAAADLNGTNIVLRFSAPTCDDTYVPMVLQT
jgi:hypothetical protein